MCHGFRTKVVFSYDTSIYVITKIDEPKRKQET